MGWNDLASAMHTGGARVVAIADVDKEILERRAGDCEKKFKAKPDLYSDYRKVLERKDVDAVIIGTPDHWHCLQACDACSAGKDVYLEKPIANSIAECDAIVNYAKKYKAVVSVGQQQNSSKMWRRVIEIARSVYRLVMHATAITPQNPNRQYCAISCSEPASSPRS